MEVRLQCDISVNCDDIKAKFRQAGCVSNANVTSTKFTNLQVTHQVAEVGPS